MIGGVRARPSADRSAVVEDEAAPVARGAGVAEVEELRRPRGQKKAEEGPPLTETQSAFIIKGFRMCW